MRLLRLLRFLSRPLVLLLALIFRPLRLRSRKNALKKHGWVELHLEGEIVEHRPAPRMHPLVRKLLRREEPRMVVLSRLRRLADELASDPYAQGILVRLGLLGGGWAAADAVRGHLERIRAAGKKVLIHLPHHAGNREVVIASSGTRVSLTPASAIASVGSSASTLFWRDALDRFGVRIEVAAKGRYKSAPESFTRTSRSEADREQTTALVEAFDAALLRAVATGRGVDETEALAMIDRAPLVGREAVAAKLADDVAREDDLLERVRDAAGTETPPRLLGARGYLTLREVPPLITRRRRHVGVVEVHGAIVDRAPSFPPQRERLAVEEAVVNDLRAALEAPEIGAVVLHVNSRGGSVTASDAIFSAVRRLDREKPVIACFGDVSASGGYYVACGARAIVCSPLTVTGSIGVFAMFPTWPELVARLGLHRDTVALRRHAALYDPWRGLDDEARTHADAQVGQMYESFLELVSGARKKTRDEVHAVAEGRVWIGSAAQAVGLIDGLGGMPEAIDRARAAAGGAFADEARLVHATRRHERPGVPQKPEIEQKPKVGALLELLRELAPDEPSLAVLEELRVLVGTAPRPVFAYTPLVLNV